MLHEDFSVIYSGTIVQADLLKCLLEGAGIQTMLENEFTGMIAPLRLPWRYWSREGPRCQARSG